MKQYQLTLVGRLGKHLREKRFALFLKFIRTLSRPLKILDVGGRQEFWDSMGFREEGVELYLLNSDKTEVAHTTYKTVIGDARHLDRLFQKGEFDVVFSNSLIEHVPSYEGQCAVASGIRRVGKRYFVQTPNRYFPLEPHFISPFFYILPRRLKVWAVCNIYGRLLNKKFRDPRYAREAIDSIRLLTARELRDMFPDGMLYKEKIFGLTKSFVVYKMEP